MKTTKAIVLMLTALALCVPPAMAQRNAGSRGGGSHSSSHSSSSSRGGSSMGSSRSSSPSTRSYSSPSSSSRSSAPSRSYSSPSSSSRSSAPSRSYSGNRPSDRPAGVRNGSTTVRSARGNSSVSEGRPAPSVNGARRAGVTSSRDGAAVKGAPAPRRGAVSGVPRAPRNGAVGGGAPRRGDGAVSRNAGAPNPGRAGVGRPNEYARAGRPGGYMPPAARPIRPAPYFHHPWHGHMVHCHPIFWDPLPPRPWYWPGFWHYCNSYWYDYHVTDVVVVHDYVQKTYNVDMVTYGISGDIMYAIVRDGGDTYLQVYDKDDHLLAEQKINRKYCNMVIDAENGGCWISKKNNKDPLLFIWADGQLLIYEED